MDQRCLQTATHAAELCLSAGRVPKAYQIETAASTVCGSTYAALGVGLGKSATALIAAKALDLPTTAYVVPSHLIDGWLEEMHRWAPLINRPVVVLQGVARLRVEVASWRYGRLELTPLGTDERFPAHYIALVAHETVRVWSDILSYRHNRGLQFIPKGASADDVFRFSAEVRQPDLVVVDEAHRFGNPRSKMTGALLQIGSLALTVLLLSGTPMKGGVPGLWSALVLLEPGQWGTYREFLVNYCAAREVRRGEHDVLEPGPQDEVPTERRAELQAALDRRMIRYRRSEVWLTGPTHQKIHRPVRIANKDALMLEEKVESLGKRMRAAGDLRAEIPFLRGEIAELRQWIAELKHRAVVESLKDLVGEGDRVVVWCWHHATVERHLTERGLKVWSAYGAQSKPARDRSIDAWAAEPGGVLAVTYGAMGTGQDRLAAHCHIQCVHELPWDADELEQALGRLDRLSQRAGEVLSYLFALKVRFEESLLDRIVQGAREADDLLGDRQTDLVSALFGLAPSYDLNRLLRGVA